MARRIDEKKYDIWFITGSQHLYGEETLKKVAADSRAVVDALNRDSLGSRRSVKLPSF